MGRGLLLLLLCAVCAVAGALGTALWLRPKREVRPDPPAVVAKVREVARLETLDVSVYKKVTFEPDPPATDSLWQDVLNYARFSLRRPSGKALLFGKAHLSFDIQRLDEQSLRIDGDAVEVSLPPLEVQVELLPAETEVLGSNLDSKETAELFELARTAFRREVEGDLALQARARASAERSIRGLLFTLGFREVRFAGSGGLGPPR